MKFGANLNRFEDIGVDLNAGVSMSIKGPPLVCYVPPLASIPCRVDEVRESTCLRVHGIKDTLTGLMPFSQEQK